MFRLASHPLAAPLAAPLSAGRVGPTSRLAVRAVRFASRHARPFENVAAPSPASLPKKRAPASKWPVRLVVAGALFGSGYAIDRYLYASSVTRTVRAVYDLMYIGLDYKFNFTEGKDIDALHERSSNRLYTLITQNKGLYIKLGQAVAIQAGIFPMQFRDKFSRLFDSAPQDTWAEIEQVFYSEFGVFPDEFFDYIDHRAFASASISQVHKARLKDTGEWVAVKIQHSDLKKQVAWDVGAYKWLMWIYEKYLFDLPIYFVAEHVAEQLQREIDFNYEAENSDILKQLVDNDSEFRNVVHVPKIYHHMSSKRVLVAEWIDGVSLSNKEEFVRSHYNSYQAVDVLTRLIARQIFSWGHVHCDPHPGNVIMRRVHGRQQLVLIDHGLYTRESDRFRHQYSRLWQGLFLLDTATVKEVAEEWGFGDVDMFASTTMMQSYGGKEKPVLSEEEAERERFKEQETQKERFQNFMKDTTKIPLELIFLGRAIRTLQGINRLYGSPVNRIKVFAYEASRSTTAVPSETWSQLLTVWRNHLVFWFTVTASDFYVFFIRVRQMFSADSPDIEDQFDDQLREALDL